MGASRSRWIPLLATALLGGACSFHSPGQGSGGGELDPGSTGGDASTGTASNGSGSGITSGDGDGDGTGSGTGLPSDDDDTTTSPSDAGDTAAVTSGTDGGPATTTGADGGSSSGDVAEETGPPPSAGYGECAGGCDVRGEVCAMANPYSVCAHPCEDAGDCPTAPGGTAPPDCFDVGLQDDLCFLDCTQGTCPAGMDCNPYGHCAWT